VIRLFAAGVALLSACAHDVVTNAQGERGQPKIIFRSIALEDVGAFGAGVIPAASKPKLRWKVEVEPKKGGTLGWKTTVYVAGFFVLKSPGARNVLCYSKIGVPMRNYLGPEASPHFASRRASAERLV
jgi:hypothetical protein